MKTAEGKRPTVGMILRLITTDVSSYISFTWVKFHFLVQINLRLDETKRYDFWFLFGEIKVVNQ